jgi:hypothetical protein
VINLGDDIVDGDDCDDDDGDDCDDDDGDDDDDDDIEDDYVDASYAYLNMITTIL